jgi:hypothetical protein
MINFNHLVNSILLEAPEPAPVATPVPQKYNLGFPIPDWFIKILDKHEALGLGKVSESDIKRIMSIVFKGYVSEQDAKSVDKNIRILDVLKNIYESARRKPARTMTAFFSQADDNKEINKLGETEAQTISQYTNKDQWEIQNAMVYNAYHREETAGQKGTGLIKSLLDTMWSASGHSLYGGT